MSTRPTCVRHLANYLETRMEISELTDLLTSLGQHEKAALIHYKQACAIQNIEARTKRCCERIKTSRLVFQIVDYCYFCTFKQHGCISKWLNIRGMGINVRKTENFNFSNLFFSYSRIKSVLQSHFHGHPDSNLLIQHVHLLERISPVIEADKRNELITQDPVLPCLDPRNETVLGTLLYFCYHHWGVGENLLHSPQGNTEHISYETRVRQSYQKET